MIRGFRTYGTPILFLLIFVPSLAFAEDYGHTPIPDEEPADTEAEKSPDQKCLETIARYPEPRTPRQMCRYQLDCEGLNIKEVDSRTPLENDYLTQLFLRHHPGISLDDSGYVINSSFDPSTSWSLGVPGSYPWLLVEQNLCGIISYYRYTMSDEPHDHMQAVIPSAIPGTKYDIATAIVGKHLAPTFQVREFDVLPHEVQCNEGLGLYMRSGDIPVCMQQQSYEKWHALGLEIKPAGP